MLGRNFSPMPPSSEEDDRFIKIINQAPRRKSSAAPKPKAAAKIRTEPAATKAAMTAPAARPTSTTAPAPLKRSTPVPNKPQQLMKRVPNQGQDSADEEEQRARTTRRKSKDVTLAQLLAYTSGHNRRKPIVLEDEEEDTVDALAMDPTSPRDESMSDQSSGEEDDPCNLSKLTASSDARASATMSSISYKLALEDTVPSVAILSSTASDNLIAEKSTNHAPETPPRRHASEPNAPCSSELVAVSSPSPLAVSANLDSEFSLDDLFTAPVSTRPEFDQHSYNRTTNEVLASKLDEEAEVMLSHIFRLAGLPREWLDFLESDDYTISRGESTMREAGHSHDVKEVLQYLLHKVNDLYFPEYSNTYVDYENIHVTTKTARNPTTHSAPEIWKPFCILRNLFHQQDKLSFSSKATKCSAIWKDVVDKAPFLFDTRRVPCASRPWSFVVLFVNTCAPQSALCQALGGVDATHEWLYRDQVLDLLGRLCREIEYYNSYTVGDIAKIWEHLHKRFLEVYRRDEASVVDDVGSVVSDVTQGESDEPERTTKRKSSERFGQDEVARKRRAVST